LPFFRVQKYLEDSVHLLEKNRLTQSQALPPLPGTISNTLHLLRHFQEDVEIVKRNRREELPEPHGQEVEPLVVAG